MSDIAAASNLSSAQLGYKVGIAVAKKSLDHAKQQGQAVLSLLDQAVEVQKQSVSTANVTGVGRSIDVQA